MKKAFGLIVILILAAALCITLIACDNSAPLNGYPSFFNGQGNNPQGGSSGTNTQQGGSSSGGNNSQGQNPSSGSGGQTAPAETVTSISIKNLYFADWSASEGDDYITYIQNAFNVQFDTSSYSYDNWNSQVASEINGAQVPDVFQANVDNYSFTNTYAHWAGGDVVKALPDEVFNVSGRWGNLAKMLNGLSDIEYLKYNGKLYGIPLARNTQGADGFAPFTYLYRRDIAKQLGVYQENDVYTWDQFENLLAAFASYFSSYGGYPLGDAEWAYPSVLNYFKTAPYCFAEETNGMIVNNYMTSEYIEGLQRVRAYVSNRWYNQNQIQFADQSNRVKSQYLQNKLGIYYDNFSLTNYVQLRKNFTQMGISGTALDDYTAILKVMGPDGKYALEEQNDWYSMTFFRSDLSQTKMETMLDIMDWLLSEKGTMMALYGIEGEDYTVLSPSATEYDYLYNGKKIKLLSENLWERNGKGDFIPAWNGARYMRYLVTLGEDLYDYDPLIQEGERTKDAYDVLKDWATEMRQAYTAGKLRILAEPAEIKWMQTEQKSTYQSRLLEEANTAVLLFTFGGINLSQYRERLNTSNWSTVLTEINGELTKGSTEPEEDDEDPFAEIDRYPTDFEAVIQRLVNAGYLTRQYIQRNFNTESGTTTAYTFAAGKGEEGIEGIYLESETLAREYYQLLLSNLSPYEVSLLRQIGYWVYFATETAAADFQRAVNGNSTVTPSDSGTETGEGGTESDGSANGEPTPSTPIIGEGDLPSSFEVGRQKMIAAGYTVQNITTSALSSVGASGFFAANGNDELHAVHFGTEELAIEFYSELSEEEMKTVVRNGKWIYEGTARAVADFLN